MISIFECYNNINEAFTSNFARMIKQDIETSYMARRYSGKDSFTKLIRDLHISNIAWDKVEDSDFEKWDDPEMLLRFIRALKSGKNDFIGKYNNKRIPIKDRNIVVFGYKGDVLNYIYTSYWEGMQNMISGNMIDKPGYIASELKECDSWYVLNIGKNETGKLRQDRSLSRSDMVPDLDVNDREHKHTRQGVLGKDAGGIDPDGIGWSNMGNFTYYCKQLVDKAKERWKKILAENKFKRTADTKFIDDLVKKCMDGYMKAMQVAMENPKDYSTWSDLKPLQQLIQGKAHGYGSGRSISAYITGGLLTSYQNYVDAVKSLAAGNATYPDSEIKNRDAADSAIRKIYEELKVTLKDKFKISI